MKKIAEDPELPEEVQPEVEEAPVEEAPVEEAPEEENLPEDMYYGLYGRGQSTREEFSRDDVMSRAIKNPNLFEVLKILHSHNQEADHIEKRQKPGEPSKVVKPLRTREELIKYFSHPSVLPLIGGTLDPLYHALGEGGGPDAPQYIGRIKDNPDQFMSIEPSKSPNLIKDETGQIGDLYEDNRSKQEVDKRLKSLTKEEEAFLDEQQNAPEQQGQGNVNPTGNVGHVDLLSEAVKTIQEFDQEDLPKLENFIPFNATEFKEKYEGGAGKGMGSYKTYREKGEAEARIAMHEYKNKELMATYAINILSRYTDGKLSPETMNPGDLRFLDKMRTRALESRPTRERSHTRDFAQRIHDMAQDPEDPNYKMALAIIGKGVVKEPSWYDVAHTSKDIKRLPPQMNEGNPGKSKLQTEMKSIPNENDPLWGRPKKTINIDAKTLKIKKKSDTTGPGGPDWTYEHTSGPTPTKDNKERRKHRFPFSNKPSKDLSIPQGGEQGNLVNSKPGVQNMDSLEATIDGMTKTADNDLFETHSFDSGDGPWMAYTTFKKAYSKFKKGDVVVQFGSSVIDIRTHRRRFGTLMEARRNFKDEVRMIHAVLNPKAAARPTEEMLANLERDRAEWRRNNPVVDHSTQQSLSEMADQARRDSIEWQRNNPPRRPGQLDPSLEGNPLFDNVPRNVAGDPDWDAMGKEILRRDEEELSSPDVTIPPTYGSLSLDPRLGGDPGQTRKVAVSVPGTSTPGDSLHDVQTGPSSGGGPYKKEPPYDKKGPHGDGFKRNVNRREEDTKRNVLPFEDQQVSNQTTAFGDATTLQIKKSEVGGFAAPVVETPEERAGKPEQDIPNALNRDHKRPFPNKRKRVDDVNESGLLTGPSHQRHDRPQQNI